MQTHFLPTSNSYHYQHVNHHLHRRHQCTGCDFPKALHLRWIACPQEYDYFVRIVVDSGATDVSSEDEPDDTVNTTTTSNNVFQGFYAHSSITFHKKRRSLPTRQLNIDLDHSGFYQYCARRNNLQLQPPPRQEINDDSISSSSRRITMMVIAVRKRDLQLGLMYAANQSYISEAIAAGMDHDHHETSSFEITMKQIHSQNTHRYDWAPTFTFGELAYCCGETSNNNNNNNNNNNGNHSVKQEPSWQLRVVCGTYDESLYMPDENAMHTFYRNTTINNLL
jgi:hypothetical protein